ncbi:hypothetical protein B9Z19DRAFT_312401 [Tuber borchii]|uniref:Uncharacterized protein n=1 Tax=Tuber borchii TaxID=42251 RepID=A0A2T6ZJX5_TUBBO|nr:hypothetical protein B9Z19DRAFT_312401 [Tuber borchii]
MRISSFFFFFLSIFSPLCRRLLYIPFCLWSCFYFMSLFPCITFISSFILEHLLILSGRIDRLVRLVLRMKGEVRAVSEEVG